MITEKWDKRFLKLAMMISTWSKDPSTKCGAIITDIQHRIVSTGYNGMAQGIVEDDSMWEDKEIKYQHVIHAEINAMMFAGRELRNCTVYTVPIQPCSHCASMLIQAGTLRIVSLETPEDIKDRWLESFMRAKKMYDQAGLSFQLYRHSDLL